MKASVFFVGLFVWGLVSCTSSSQRINCREETETFPQETLSQELRHQMSIQLGIENLDSLKILVRQAEKEGTPKVSVLSPTEKSAIYLILKLPDTAQVILHKNSNLRRDPLSLHLASDLVRLFPKVYLAPDSMESKKFEMLLCALGKQAYCTVDSLDSVAVPSYKVNQVAWTPVSETESKFSYSIGFQIGEWLLDNPLRHFAGGVFAIGIQYDGYGIYGELGILNRTLSDTVSIKDTVWYPGTNLNMPGYDIAVQYQIQNGSLFRTNILAGLGSISLVAPAKDSISPSSTTSMQTWYAGGILDWKAGNVSKNGNTYFGMRFKLAYRKGDFDKIDLGKRSAMEWGIGFVWVSQ